MTMTGVYEAMFTFHRRNGAYVHHGGRDVPEEIPLLRARLILEEFSETVEAIHEEKLVDMADGLADLFYVLVGTQVSYFPRNRITNTRLEWPKFSTNVLPGGFFFDPSDSLQTVQHLTSVVANLVTALEDESSERLWFMLQYALQGVCDVAAVYYIDLSACFAEVHRSNLSKELGGSGNGRKYGEKVAKGETYSPPDLLPILRSVGHEV